MNNKGIISGYPSGMLALQIKFYLSCSLWQNNNSAPASFEMDITVTKVSKDDM